MAANGGFLDPADEVSLLEVKLIPSESQVLDALQLILVGVFFKGFVNQENHDVNHLTPLLVI